ncbi:MFS transporter [Roseibium sp.]|uniref:MFS transporter n=1 Tax=Roseibium sp. TaxID=1936156 RepID=UPI003A97B3AB
MPQNYAIALLLLSNSFHQSTLVVLVPVLQSIYDLPLSALSLIIGGGLLVSAASVPLWGRLATRHGTKPVLIATTTASMIGIAVLAASVALTISSDQFIYSGLFLLIASRLIYSMSACAALPISQALQVSSGQATALLGRLGSLGAVNSLGRLAGNGLIGPLLTFGILLPVAIVLPFYAFVLHGLRRTSWPEPAKLARQAQKIPGYRLPTVGILSAGGIQLAVGGAYVLLGPLLKDRLALSPEGASGVAGLLLMAALATGMVSQLFLTRLFRDRFMSAFTIGCGLASCGFAFLVVGSTMAGLGIGTCLLASGTALALSANQATSLAAANDIYRSQTSTLLASVQLLGLAAGTSLFGILGSIDVAQALTAAAFLPLALAIAVPSHHFLKASLQTIREGSHE